MNKFWIYDILVCSPSQEISAELLVEATEPPKQHRYRYIDEEYEKRTRMTSTVSYPRLNNTRPNVSRFENHTNRLYPIDESSQSSCSSIPVCPLPPKISLVKSTVTSASSNALRDANQIIKMLEEMEEMEEMKKEQMMMGKEKSNEYNKENNRHLGGASSARDRHSSPNGMPKWILVFN